jgi:RNA-directed DNA polymerase
LKEGKSFIISQHQVAEAYKRVKANKGAAGIDDISFEEIEKDLKNQLYKVWNRLSSGSYFPMPVKGCEIPKKNGKMRLLGIPTIIDRVAQTVLLMNFEPILEPIFHEDSYGYRPGKSTIDAVRVTRTRCWEMPWVLEFDIVGLFDNIDHELLMQVVRKHTDSKFVIMYIERIIRADMVMPDGTTRKRTAGVPQGGCISGLLSNLFMHYAFDRWMAVKNPNNPWARYADDAVIHCQTKEEAQEILQTLKKRLKDCKLEVHPDKTKIVYCRSDKNNKRYENESFTFLGYTFRIRRVVDKKGRLFNGFTPAVSRNAAKQFREKMRECRSRNRLVSLEELARIMNPIIRGWANNFMHFNPSEAKRTALDYVNLVIVKWAMRKYKNLARHKCRAYKWLYEMFKTNPKLFHHWQLGLCPTME